MARALQARLDGVDGWDSIATLAATGYLTDASGWSDIRLEKTGTVRSAIYGPLATMSPLDDLPLEEVTPEEAEAYERYVENYSRYWRQFFDPIAIRLNDTADGALELSTFILPLVDNSLYNGLRTSLMREEQNRQLQVPHLHPQPVLQLSANLQTDAMDRFAKSLFVSFQRF
ncbi:MAG: hypothetical protein KDA87_27760, partial [Planctomycetales bacterium]|nr:hypothetical protein [Planctomycetales bacterium]